MSETQAGENKSERGLRKERTGKVASTKGDKTIIVEVVRLFPHPLYGKYIRRTMRFHAHDEQNRCNVGDTVKIIECRPLSRLKRWRLGAILERAK